MSKGPISIILDYSSTGVNTLPPHVGHKNLFTPHIKLEGSYEIAVTGIFLNLDDGIIRSNKAGVKFKDETVGVDLHCSVIDNSYKNERKDSILYTFNWNGDALNNHCNPLIFLPVYVKEIDKIVLEFKDRDGKILEGISGRVWLYLRPFYNL